MRDKFNLLGGLFNSECDLVRRQLDELLAEARNLVSNGQLTTEEYNQIETALSSKNLNPDAPTVKQAIARVRALAA